MQKYITDEIRSYVNRLIDNGKTGSSNSYNGITQQDEAHLVSLLMQAIPYSELPTLHKLDIHGGLPLMIARLIGKQDTYNSVELSNYIATLYIDHFLPDIKQLFENSNLE